MSSIYEAKEEMHQIEAQLYPTIWPEGKTPTLPKCKGKDH
jgi:hypothetical protein